MKKRMKLYKNYSQQTKFKTRTTTKNNSIGSTDLEIGSIEHMQQSLGI